MSPIDPATERELPRFLDQVHPAVAGFGETLREFPRFDPQANLELARSLLEQTEIVRDGFAGPDSFSKVRILLNYAATLDWLGESDKALPYVERGVAIMEDLGGPEDRAYLLALDIAGAVNLHTGHLDRAREQLERVVAGEATLIERFPDFEFTLYNLAAVLAGQGESEQALRRLEQALDAGFARDDIFEEPGFDSLRGEPEFEAIADEVRRRIERTGGGTNASGDRAGTTVPPNS